MKEEYEAEAHARFRREVRETWGQRFVRESNMIEGIHQITPEEVAATVHFVDLTRPTVKDLVKLVKVYQPNAVLRSTKGLDVRVGSYLPPPGGPDIVDHLEAVLNDNFSPWHRHCEYEKLHPFTDGNGRSGRALWAWAMFAEGHGVELSFLHHFYYQTLTNYR